jgi:hypothetical protein
LPKNPTYTRTDPQASVGDTVFSAGTGKRRIAIIIRNDNIDAILLYKISDEDTVVLELTYNNLRLYTICMYFDIKDQIDSNLNKINEILKVKMRESSDCC